MAEITFRNVGKVYSKKVRALSGIDLTIRDGEFFVLLGPSGCGKTTMLRLISGVDRPDEGDILFDGVSVLDKKPQERNTAMVFQNFALYPHMTVYKNIAYPLVSRKFPKEETDRRVREIAELFGITELLGKRPRVLSGGQRQLCAIARAMVREPDIFLLDEPFSNLDAALRDELRQEVRKAHRLRPHTTFVYVTHDQSEAMSLSDRIAVMHDGRIPMCGSPATIYRDPADLFTAVFFGTPGINKVPASAEETEDGTVLRIGTVKIPFPDGREYAGRKLIAGIRAENLIPVPENGIPDTERAERILIPGCIQGTARTGSGRSFIVTIDGAGEEQYFAQADTEYMVSAGSTAHFAVRKEAVLLFDPESGARIRTGEKDAG